MNESSVNKTKNLIPNILTMLRICITPILVCILLCNKGLNEEYRYIFGFVIFLIAALTDMFDGIIARATNSITEFGIFIDPIADKILIHSTLISLVFLHKISPFVVILLVIRDMLVNGIRLIDSNNGEINAPNIIGKIKTGLEIFLISFILLSYDIELSIQISKVLTFLTLLFSFWSAYILLASKSKMLMKRFLGKDI